jgi:hypothetical protein
MRTRILVVVMVAVLASADAGAWGPRAHTWINRVAVQTLPADGPVFLKAQEDWIAYLSVIPDAWRRPSEPFLKMLEDPNHGWFKEQFSFMRDIPRSRYEFVLKLYDEQRRLAAAGDPAATLTNVRWTGTMAYAAVEGYERMVTGMRHYRDAKGRNEDTRFIEQEIAFYMGWTGHYTGDGAQPLHDTIHHDGWQGSNPNGYTPNPQVHGLFESRFVELMQLDGAHLLPKVTPARVLTDPFTAILSHLDEAATHTEQVYRLEKSGALADGNNAEARALVIQQAARGAALLRDLAYTAWIKSAAPPEGDPDGNPITPSHPRYNPQTGSAPAHAPGAATRPKPQARAWPPVAWADPVIGKNFYLFQAIAESREIATAIQASPQLAPLRERRVASLLHAAESCGMDTACHASALKWNEDAVAAAESALRGLATTSTAMRTFVAQRLRPSGLFARYSDETDAGLLGLAWRDAAAGINRIVAVYALGTPPLYPAIDAVSYDPASETYRRLIDMMVSVMAERSGEARMFYDVSLDFARRLLDANRRDEAARYEPLEKGENAAAWRRVGITDWSRYAYTAIIVPGAGPDRADVALDPYGKVRLELAVARFRAGKAPFLIVSGGFVHPSQTPFSEAFEMKRSLIRDFGVPPEAILIDPHARHTTTNLRNASRLAIRYGMPAGRAMLITSDASQSSYISGAAFRERCQRELGYQPGTLGARLSRFDLEFTPSIVSLHADSRDPLDP